MDILKKLTIKNLKLNKKRTIVTIIGIILATALITAITTILSSYQASSLAYSRKHFGNYHIEIFDVPQEDINRIVNIDGVESPFLTQNVGYGSFNYEQKNLSVQVLNFSSEALNNLGIELVEGRFPTTTNEIIISTQFEQVEEINFSLGTKISLSIQGDENITKDYTIVGIINILNRQIEPLNSGSDNNYYTFISYLDTNNLKGNYNIYLRFSNLLNRMPTILDIFEIDEKTYSRFKEDTIAETEGLLLNSYYNPSIKYNSFRNSSLISSEFGNDSDQTNEMLLAIFIVMLIIVILVSAYCIKNSFNISITEKIKQYGMLASIGITSKQIKQNVLYEAFVLGIIGIPIGIVLGIGSIYLVLKFAHTDAINSLFNMEFIFSTNIIAIAFAIVFSTLTVYLSARKSAKLASKITPIEAIRSNQDIKVKAKNIKTPRFIEKLFGIGGIIAYKNMKRNKRNYRTTVVSIIMAVSAFISLITFTNYSFQALEIYNGNLNFNIIISGDDYNSLKEISQDSIIKDYSLVRWNIGLINNFEEHLSNEAMTLDTGSTHTYFNINIKSFGQQEYQRFVTSLGLSYEDVKDKGILMDYITDSAKIDGENRIITYRAYNYQAGDTIEISSMSSQDDGLFSIEIATVTDQKPIGFDGINQLLMGTNEQVLIVSDELYDKYSEFQHSPWSSYDLCIVTDDSEKLTEYISQVYSNNYSSLVNADIMVIEHTSIYNTISIFLYTFIAVMSLIGITNIFNTITTSMKLRQKEFAHLKSIGMTKKEFNKMIKLENIFIGFKALIRGIPLGIIFSYIVHLSFETNVIMDYIFPISGIIISIVSVFLILWIITLYSLRKINKQNIIETIRRDNV